MQQLVPTFPGQCVSSTKKDKYFLIKYAEAPPRQSCALSSSCGLATTNGDITVSFVHPASSDKLRPRMLSSYPSTPTNRTYLSLQCHFAAS